MKKLIKAVIFDLDGVLADSQPVHFEADRLVLAECGAVEFDPDAIYSKAGMLKSDRLAKYKNEFALAPDVAQLSAMHDKIIYGLIESGDLRATDNAAAVLDMLAESGIERSVASSSGYTFIYKLLEKIRLADKFNFIISGEDMKNGKPAPDIFLRALEKHGAEAEKCVVIEDSSAGVKAARAAGIRCIGYRNLSSGFQDLSGACFVISDFKELLDGRNWIYCDED